MDITSVYRSRLESIKKLQKDIPPELQNTSHTNTSNNNNAIGAKSKLFPGKKSEYYVRARELCSTISSLKDFLVENRKAYLNFGSGPRNNNNNSSFSSSTFGKNSSAVWKNLNNTKEASFSDIERDQIDDDVQKIIRNCQKKIFEYEKLIETSDIVQSCPQLHTHLENIHNSLADYLKDVCTIHSGMRAVRVKRTVDYQTMSKLASHRHNKNNSTSKGAHSSSTNDNNNSTSVTSSSSSSSATTSTTTTHTTSASSSSSSSKSKSSRLSASHSNNNKNIDHDQTDNHQHGISSNSNVPAYFEEEPSAEELQIFEAENAHLLNELNTVSDEVDQVATNVLQIAQLQEEITSKILEQDIQMDRISNVVVGATENIRGGNEQIRQAIQKNADFRAWVLFFIIVMSFSLLFLDWYND